jgi:putative ABC transport system ATP-binding protein
MPTNVVETSNLHKTYLLGTVAVHALRGVSFTIAEGDLVAILGPSGSGKSTLLNMIGGLDKPTTGRVAIAGVDLATLDDNQLAELRRNIGFVFQFFNLIPRFTAKENVELTMAIQGVSKKARRARAESLLETVGLKDRMDHRPAELSGGERQRVAIGRALANHPQFLLMDEPTGNIDSKTADEIMGLVKTLNEAQGVTIVVVTHDQRVAHQARRTVTMLDGTIVEDKVNSNERT